MDSAVATEHRAKRFSHALYGLIIITATLAAEESHAEIARDALVRHMPGERGLQSRSVGP